MRTTLITLALALLTAGASPAWAKGEKKEKAEVTFLVSMTCENCQKRIESHIAYEKGVTDLRVNLPQKTVTIEYRTDKTDPAALKEALRKLGYTVTPFRPKKDKADAPGDTRPAE